jgi:ubiquinone/menaquinone biosynthesis C-methylase UbiE
LAFYRRHATFVGVDGAQSQIQVADARRCCLGLSNVEFIHADFLKANDRLSGEFDYIVAHGVFSWISQDVRDALLELCAQRLCKGGLLYLNYNTRPGWNVRGLVREFLLAQTAGASNLRTRAELAQEVSAKVVSSLSAEAQPYSQLLANEFRFVSEHDVSYIAHEYLANDNHAYWRSDFLVLARQHGFEYVADADFNYPSGRISEDLAPRLVEEKIIGRTIDDTVDLLCYRQLHSPILTHGPLTRLPPSLAEFANLRVASCLAPCGPSDQDNPMFQHPSGYQVEAKEDVIQAALIQLQPFWPRGLRIREVFPDVSYVLDDIRLLQRNGLIELRCIEPGETEVCREPLNRLEAGWGDSVTSPYHTCEVVPAELKADYSCSNAHSPGQPDRDGRGARNGLLSPPVTG